jgi:hypothetical protein
LELERSGERLSAAVRCFEPIGVIVGEGKPAEVACRVLRVVHRWNKQTGRKTRTA